MHAYCKELFVKGNIPYDAHSVGEDAVFMRLVAFTYNEPLVGWEYVRDTARLVRESGMKNVLVTNGSVSLEVLEEIFPLIDAMNIDLKGFREETYRRLGGNGRGGVGS